MTPTRRTILTLAALCFAAPFAAANAQAADERPNIVFFLSDDHRADVLGCARHPIIQTPNLDKLAAQGARFPNAFVTTSICAASRATLLTGLYERTHGFTFGTPPIATRFIDDSYPVKLREAGYRTGFFGKFGVNVEGGRAAIDRMFDVFENLHRSPYFKKMPDGTQRHVDDLTTDKAIAFIESTPEGKPFCLSVSFNGGHAEDGDKENHFPYPPSADGLYEGVEMPRPELDDPAIFEALPQFMRESMNRDRYFWRWDTPEKYQKNMRNYLRLLSGVDHNVGRVMQTLKDRGLDGNTVVLFMGDNGYYMGERGFAGKWSHFEESLRVPLIVHDPRLPSAAAGATPKGIALNIDVAPTILALAGVDAPQRYQGRSLTLPLRGAKIADRSELFCEHRMNHKAIPKWEGIRGERYVYANYYEQGDGGYEFLHDLEKDPKQLTNFAGDPAYADVLAQMRQRTRELSARYAQEGGADAAKPQAAEEKRDPRILLLGDSISMGYHGAVVDALRGEAVVTRPKENCQGTTHGVAKIDEWLQLAGGDFDIIHFNFGLHDLKHVEKPGDSKAVDDPDKPYQATVEQYEKNLRQIVAKLKQTDATLIFATTTPVPEGSKPHRDPKDPPRYNAVALKIMAENGIAIDDLYAFALPQLDKIQRPKNVHFTKEGSAVLAEEVVRHLRAAMKDLAAQ